MALFSHRDLVRHPGSVTRDWSVTVADTTPFAREDIRMGQPPLDGRVTEARDMGFGDSDQAQASGMELINTQIWRSMV
jgi:hypothetical protein